MKITKPLLCMLAILCLSNESSAAVVNTTLDFEQYVNSPNSTNVGTSVKEDGYTLTATRTSGTPGGFATRASSSSAWPGSSGLTGSTVVGNGITLTKDDKSLFDLLSINLSSNIKDGSFSATFTGTTSAGAAVTQTFSGKGHLFQSFTFDNTFKNLTQVSWSQVSSNFHQFDDIKLSSGSSTPVPEPESYALFLAGLGLLSFVTRRKQA